MAAMKAKVQGNKLVVEIDLQPPTASKSGKTKVVASSYGNQTIPDLLIEGQPVTIGLNAYIHA